MKIVRVPFAVSLALLAAAAIHAAVPMPAPPKPPADGAADPRRDAWRAEALAICVGEMAGAQGVGADELQATCGCAIDHFMTRRPTAGLPAPAPGLLRASMGGDLLGCASDQRPAVTVALARRLAEPATGPVSPSVPSANSKPDGTPPPAAADAPKPADGDAPSRLDGLSLPAWIGNSGMPTWAWILLGFIAFMVLRGLLRGGNQRDLIGPPPNMRLGARANPPAPRRADPPQRG